MDTVERIIRPVEGFSVKHVEVAGADLYGIRRVRAIDRDDKDPFIEIECGYAHTADLPTGPVEIHFPARDTTGESGTTLILTIPVVTDWRVLVHGEMAYRKGVLFTYCGRMPRYAGKLEVVYDGDPLKTRHCISTNATLWWGRE
jgi:hypothetical protein